MKGKVVDKIFCGENQTWFILDYDDPYLSMEDGPSTLNIEENLLDDEELKNIIESPKKK